MVEEQQEPTTQARRFPEDTELPEDGRAVVIDPFSRELAVLIERIHTAQRELESPPGCGKLSAPMSRTSDAGLYTNDGPRPFTVTEYNGLRIAGCAAATAGLAAVPIAWKKSSLPSFRHRGQSPPALDT